MFGRKRKFFGNSIEPSCSCCANFLEYGDDDTACKAGKDPEGGKACPHFCYDPLRRTPTGPLRLKKHDPDEFKL